MTLSDKRQIEFEGEDVHGRKDYCYTEEDVKEFIKELKDWFDNPSKEVHCSRDRIYRKINELAGEKLNGN